MRVRDIELTDIELLGKEKSHVACGWVGCRNPEGACAFAKYKIRTGRTQAGMWQERIMPVCMPHKEEFKQKYMQNLCPNCLKNPVDENSTRKGYIWLLGKPGAEALVCDWCPKSNPH